MMMLAVASNGTAFKVDRRAWQIILLIAALHFMGAAGYKYGLPDFYKPQKSEITIELSGVMQRGEGGTGARQVAAPTPSAPQKTRVEDDLASKQVKETPKAASSAAASTASAAAGVESAPVIDADYKASYLNNPKPPYPPLAFQMRIEGTVMLKAHVQPDGSCGEVLLARSSGNELLDRSALNTVAQWKFTPAKSQGKDIAQWVSIPITFSIKRRS